MKMKNLLFSIMVMTTCFLVIVASVTSYNSSITEEKADRFPYTKELQILSPNFATVGGWILPTNSSNFCGYLGWLGYNSAYNGYHLAQDMCNPYNNPVYSLGDGEVVSSRTDVGSYGRDGGPGGAILIRYRAADGNWFIALIGHLNYPRGVGPVLAGEIVGYSNDTDPPHVHLGIRPGYDLEPNNPWRGYTSTTSNTYGFVAPIPFLTAHPRGAIPF